MFSRSGLDTEKETFNILSPSQNPLPNDVLLILDLQFMDIEIWCVHVHITTKELKQALISALSNVCAQNSQVLFQKDRLKMQQCDRNKEMPVLYKTWVNEGQISWIGFMVRKTCWPLYGSIRKEYHLELCSIKYIIQFYCVCDLTVRCHFMPMLQCKTFCDTLVCI